MFSTFLAPNDTVIAFAKAGKTIDAIKAFRALDHRLSDGTEIVPSLRIAKLTVDGIRKFGLTIPMVVEVGEYAVRDRDAEAAAAVERAAVHARFVAYATEDGITIGGRYGAFRPLVGEHRCDICNRAHDGVAEIYAPDSMGYPTVVLTACDATEPRAERAPE